MAAIEGDDLGEHFARLGAAFENADYSVVLRDDVRPIVLQGVRDNFTSSASPEGDDWPPRKDKGDGHPLLIDTGRLLQAAVGSGAGSLTTVESQQLEVGVTGIPYAAIHNYGGRTRPMPQREYMGASEKRLQEIDQKIIEAVGKLIGGVS